VNEEILQAEMQLCESLANRTPSAGPKVSMVILSYNQEAYISDAIASALSQSYGNLEIIVSDDGSNDETPRLIAEWAERFPDRIIAILNRNNSGISKNCNAALARCTGEFIAFMGADDILLPRKTREQVLWFQRNPDAVLCGHRVDVNMNGFVTTPDASYTNYGSGFGPKQFIKKGMQLHGISLMVRASAIPSHGYDESIPMASDLMFCIDVLASGGGYGFVDETLMVYRIHPANISKRSDTMTNDLALTFRAVATRYPEFKRLCQSSITRHVYYFGGVRKLAAKNAAGAIGDFRRAIARNPLFLKAWVRLLQAIFVRLS
jgi:glycosyltransferase involved in cell wall biosynthesis